MTLPKERDLKAAVLAYLAEHGEADVPTDPYDHPGFLTTINTVTGTSTVEHVHGRPNITAVSLKMLDDIGKGNFPIVHLGWDGECLTMPGDLRYRPIGLDRQGWAVVCRRVGA